MPGALQKRNIDTTWGTIVFQTLDGRVLECHLPVLDRQPRIPFSIRQHGDDAATLHIIALFEGRKCRLPPLATPEGSAFQQTVWNSLLAIPFGETRSYGEVAEAIGRPTTYRAVANACGANRIPLFIPCHRVVGAQHAIGGFSSGLAWKRLLLSCEGAAGF
jgi:methylated-DNA-[protein]-cysteine S-methyltransferase